MIDLLRSGGFLFTLPLTALAVAVAGLIVKKTVDLFARTDQPPAVLQRGLSAIVQLGGFSFIFGLLGQALGLYQMLAAIEEMGAVPPAMVAGGLKVSFIAPVYGLLIFTAAALGWLLLNLRYRFLRGEARVWRED